MVVRWWAAAAAAVAAGAAVTGATGGAPSAADEAVTYGSAIVLRHLDTDTRLFSTAVEWGFGSREQIVTAYPDPDYDFSYFWQVLSPAHGAGKSPVKSLPDVADAEAAGWNTSDRYAAGAPVKCGDRVRLVHTETEKFLHSRGIAAFLKPSDFEVSAAHKNRLGQLKESADFVVTCKSKSQEVWHYEDTVALKHALGARWLTTSSAAAFTGANCPRCPVVGHFEVTLCAKPGSTRANWAALPGLTLERMDDAENGDAAAPEHDEL